MRRRLYTRALENKVSEIEHRRFREEEEDDDDDSSFRSEQSIDSPGEASVAVVQTTRKSPRFKSTPKKKSAPSASPKVQSKRPVTSRSNTASRHTSDFATMDPLDGIEVTGMSICLMPLVDSIHLTFLFQIRSTSTVPTFATTSLV